MSKRLERAGIKAVEWEERNYVTFDNTKNEAIAFKWSRKPKLKSKIVEAKITVRRHMMTSNSEDTRWLRANLDSGLQFRAHKNLTLRKARRAEDRWRHLTTMRGLVSGLVR